MARRSPHHYALAAVCAAAALTLSPLSTVPAAGAPLPGPRNIIVLISDGAGFNQFDATNFYRTGRGAYQVVTSADGTVSLDPNNTTGVEDYMQPDWSQVAMSHHSQTTIDAGYTYRDTNAWGEFDWVTHKPTDSAAAGTAMSTGAKTSNGILGYASDGTTRLTTAGEVAMASGRKLGLVTSVPFNHATPAAFIAHNTDRNDYQGLATEMLYSGADVLMGAGHPRYTDDHTERTADYTWIDPGDYSSLIGGKTPMSFIEQRSQFEALANAGSAATQEQCRATIGSRPIAGIAQVAETLQERRAGGTEADVEIGVTPLNDVPTLETMTRGALNRLSTDSNGMFLMVEGGAVDWAGHSNFTNHLIEEQTDFNNAVQAVVDWVETRSSWQETLVIVTADHETGYLAGVGANPQWTPMAGQADRVPEVTWHSGNHTNALVPFFVRGNGSELFLDAADEQDSVRGAYLDNTEMGTIIQQLMTDNAVSPDTGALTDPCAGIADSGTLTPEPTSEATPSEGASEAPGTPVPSAGAPGTQGTPPSTGPSPDPSTAAQTSSPTSPGPVQASPAVTDPDRRRPALARTGGVLGLGILVLSALPLTVGALLLRRGRRSVGD
ncbi:MAG: alkaline phosphatase [Actinomyces sp.]|uniref:alkaline phosphatase n=1 Tax=Actinomyces sp. TaxID=29317 RepID=UPI0026DC1A2D|nr:alkaline phosphatase [Actinomyces sp.]MDO4244246.1 alkaline phosphatase [Actinomyces sp.]